MQSVVIRSLLRKLNYLCFSVRWVRDSRQQQHQKIFVSCLVSYCCCYLCVTAAAAKYCSVDNYGIYLSSLCSALCAMLLYMLDASCCLHAMPWVSSSILQSVADEVHCELESGYMFLSTSPRMNDVILQSIGS